MLHAGDLVHVGNFMHAGNFMNMHDSCRGSHASGGSHAPSGESHAVCGRSHARVGLSCMQEISSSARGKRARDSVLHAGKVGVGGFLFSTHAPVSSDYRI